MQERETESVKLAVLEEKVINMVEVISKLDETIIKLSDLSANVSKMLAVHEEKLEVARESAAETAKEIVLLENKMEQHIQQNSTRIRSLERRVWIGIGIMAACTFLLQTVTVTGLLADPAKPAIIEAKPKP